MKRAPVGHGLQHGEIGEHPAPNPVRVFTGIVVQNQVRAPQDTVLIAEHESAPELGSLVEITHIALQTAAHREIHGDVGEPVQSICT